jgi:CHAT domain-containing protein/Tfp pilus assembly protein PilF
MKGCRLEGQISMGLFRSLGFIVVFLVGVSPAFGQGTEARIRALNEQFFTHYEHGRYAEADEFALETLQLVESTFGPQDPNTAAALNNLAALRLAEGRYKEAEPLYKRALNIVSKARGADHPSMALSLNNLAELFRAQARFKEAEPLYARAIEINEAAKGPQDPDTAKSLNNLALLYQTQGRYDEAKPIYDRALETYEAAFGSKHSSVANCLNNLALLYHYQGNYSEAETLYERALAIAEAIWGPDHPDVANSLSNLAGLYGSTGRFDEAERHHVRALAIREVVLGARHPDVANTLNNLALVYHAQDRYDEALDLDMRALAIRETAFGLEHPNVATSYIGLAGHHKALGRYDEAERLFEHARAIYETNYGSEHPAVATSLNNLADLYRAQGRYEEAEPLLTRAQSIYEKAFGPEHPSVAISFGNLAEIYRAQARLGIALHTIRQSSQAFSDRTVRQAMNRSTSTSTEIIGNANAFVRHVSIAWELLIHRKDLVDELSDEAFGAAQMALQTAASRALTQMGARFSSGEDDLSLLAKSREDGVSQWQAVRKLINDERTAKDQKVNQDKIARLRDQLTGIDQRLDALEGELRERFPKYAEFSSPKPLSLKQTQESLSSGEALVSFLATKDATFVWAVTPDDVVWRSSEIDLAELTEDVANLRKGVSHDGGAVRLDLAHKLYNKLFAPIEDTIKGVEHIIVAPSGPLQSLPFAVLLTELPDAPIGTYEDLRQAPWLIRDFAISVLPAVSSLRAIRTYASATTAPSAFIGFGDPILNPSWSKKTGLAALPETADELKAIAASLSAPDSPVFLDSNATETSVKATSLEDYRVVAFATHGLVAGDGASDLEEPALVLSHPAAPSDQDDGFLTASEVALLNMNADWVILSACNTAAGYKPGADPLSGLARAFFYAGSKALLASHWPVYSDAAVALITKAFAEIKDDPSLSRAEAMRRAMVALMADTSEVANAHPARWAPFIIVGEGG